MTWQKLISYVLEKGASDLHIVADYPPRMRVNGELVTVGGEAAISAKLAEQMIEGLMNEEQKEIVYRNRELDMSFEWEGKARLRANIYFQRGMLAASLRVISKAVPSIDVLGLPRLCHELVKFKQGLVLVTGPTGQGKSTTLAAILEEINQTRSVHIVTIEDPVEYQYTQAKALVSQREVHSDTRTWAAALRSVLREDPDVVLIGEMRDLETISAALTIAETGHLVFASLHTNSASQTVDRILDVFPETQQAQIRIQLSETLETVLSQRLVPKVGGGRVMAAEIMLGTAAVRVAIREARTHMLDNIMLTSGEFGMVTLESALADLVRRGVIVQEVAKSYSLRSGELSRFIRSVG